jgi:hypothetical protein
VQLRKGKPPRWGALKIRECLQAQLGEQRLPAVSTIELFLKHNGLVKKRRQTVMDSYSRYVLGFQGMHYPTFEGTRARICGAFRGIRAARTDPHRQR